MKRLRMTAVRVGFILAMASTALMIPAANAATSELYLAGTKITAVDTRIPGNDLVPSPPNGPGTVIEPNTTEPTTAIWDTAPLADALVLLPGKVDLELMVKNYSENAFPEGNDICWSKRVRLPGQPDGTLGPIIVVAPSCFENTFPAVGSGTCPPSFVLGQSPPAPGCVPQGKLIDTKPSAILSPTVIPAGSVIELRIWCPGASFIGAFFNDNFPGGRSLLREPEAKRVREGRLTGGGTTTGLFDEAGIVLPVTVDIHQGLTLHCDETQLPNNLEVNWDGGNHFHLDTLDSATCFDDPTKVPNPPPAGFDSYIGSGTGSCNGVPGATARWYFTDEGEPGTQDDVVSLSITCADGNTVTVVGQNNVQGNFQAHGQ
jgi:hypothetical protein